MADVPLPGRDSVDAQRELFRLAAKEVGLTIAVIAARSPLKVSILKGWANGTAMPAWAIGALGEAGVPDHLLSLLLEPFGRHVGTDENEDGCLHALGREAAHYTADMVDAESDGVVTPIEKSKLQDRARRIAGMARRASK